ncbi:MAG: HIT domain-containing protein [Chloroflexota bacterium]|nr:HIT domain-containing protein [Chloroflexota bacterium]
MAYVRGEKRHGGDCPFCVTAAQAGDLPELIVHAGRLGYVTLNLYPYNNGHVLVLPYRHVADLDDLEPDEAGALMSLVVQARVALQQAFSPDGYNVGMNLGSAAGAGIPSHLHFHVVPRWAGDTNFMPVTGDVKVMPETLDQTKLRLMEAWPD